MKIETRRFKSYGMITLITGETFALLRPVPFKPEYALPGVTSFFVAYNENGYHTPHVLHVSCPFFIDEYPTARDIKVQVAEEEEVTKKIEETVDASGFDLPNFD